MYPATAQATRSVQIPVRPGIRDERMPRPGSFRRNHAHAPAATGSAARPVIARASRQSSGVGPAFDTGTATPEAIAPAPPRSAV